MFDNKTPEEETAEEFEQLAEQLTQENKVEDQILRVLLEISRDIKIIKHEIKQR